MIYGLLVLRVCYGPLPIFLYNIIVFLTGFAVLFVAIIVAMYTFTRFMFVCVWKRMRQMDDDLIVRIATIQAIVVSLLFSAAKWFKIHGQGGLELQVSFFLCEILLNAYYSLINNTKFQYLINYLFNFAIRRVLEFCSNQTLLYKDL